MGVLAWFSLNRDYIANVLCENRERPELHCVGQCVLMKKLKKLEEEGAQQKNENRSANMEWQALLPLKNTYSCIQTIELPQKGYPFYTPIYSYLFTQIPLIPPKNRPF